MNIRFIDTKHKLGVKSKDIEDELIWGSRLFMNAQVLLYLITMISKYRRGEEDIQTIFTFINMLKKQHSG